MRFTINRMLVAAAIFSVAAGFLIERVTLGSSLSLALGTVGLASPLLFLVVILYEVLSKGWHRGERGLRPTEASASSRRPRFTVLQLMFAIAIVSVMCWWAVTLVPIWWAAFHEPTSAEMAARLRQDAARWTRLAGEHPSLAKEYLRLAERSSMAAGRLDRGPKATP